MHWSWFCFKFPINVLISETKSINQTGVIEMDLNGNNTGQLRTFLNPSRKL